MRREKYILTLLNLQSIGRKSAIDIAKNFYENSLSFHDIIQHIRTYQEKNRRVKIPSIGDIEVANKTALQILDNSIKSNVNVIAYGSSEYPSKFLDYRDPPAIFYIRGDLSALHYDKSIAIIGTRNPTDYGHQCCLTISRKISENGISVVSGLAKGCDTYAHQGCLNGGGVTVAVLAHGLQMIYPTENKKLAEEIIHNKGCLISEYPLGETPRPNRFIERDRLQTALSDAVFFIETGIKGGTMHAVNECLKVGKPLACLQPREHDCHIDSVQGNLSMIGENKVTPIKNSDALQSFLEYTFLNRSKSAQEISIEYEQIDIPFE